jgi:hypothetical protein
MKLLRSLAASQPNILPVLLQLGDKSISLLDDVVVLLVLVVGSICLNYSIHSIDSAWNSISGDKFR